MNRREMSVEWYERGDSLSHPQLVYLLLMPVDSIYQREDFNKCVQKDIKQQTWATLWPDFAFRK